LSNYLKEVVMMRRMLAVTCVVMVIGLCDISRGAPATSTTKPAKPTVAIFALSGPLVESGAQEDLALFGPQPESLTGLLARMKKAGDDANVKAVVILCEAPMLGLAQIEEVRQAMGDLKEKGKDVYAYGDALSFPMYVLMTGATRVSVVPTGVVMAAGLHGYSPYLRGLLDKIGVTPDFMTCGEYKSAAEIFMRTEPSKQADEMHNWLLDSMFESAVNQIAEGRKVPADQVKKWIDTGLYTADKAKAANLIDAVETRQQLGEVLKKKYGNDIVYDRRYGKKQPPQMNFNSPFAMFQVLGEMFGGNAKPKSTKPAVGIVYVDGAIMLGKGEASIFGSSGAFSTEIRRALDQAAKDDSIKAVVLRIDSPGGSATASEIILEATRAVKAKKPLVVSMGNVAGSGGYYVACAADTIFADPSTMTGSIGVVTGKLVTTEMWKKIGVTFKPYQRGANAGLLASDEPFTESERAQMRAFMDEIYGIFKQHVVDVRGKKLKKDIEQLAGGRVYTGKQALDLGLIDQLGSMSDAVAFAAKEAKMNDYDTRVVPEPKNFLEKLMEQASGDEEDRASVSLGKLPAARTSLVDLAKPYLQGLDPQRVQLVTEALEKLQLLEQDRVLMVMPEPAITN
jgi:protease-4